LPTSQLTWLDSSGKPTGTIGDPAQNHGFSVAPDRARIAIERLDPQVNSVDPWILQLNSGFITAARPRAEGHVAITPTWSADGSTIASYDIGGLREVPVAGGADTFWPMAVHWPLSSSPDGRFLLIAMGTLQTGSDLMMVPLTGDHTPVPYLNTSVNESAGRIAPDGHSVAYVSDESDRREVYVQSFPKRGNKVRVSVNGGANPQWSDDGKTLYFVAVDLDGKPALMRSEIRAGGPPPVELFEIPAGPREASRPNYAVFDNGRRFLFNVFVPDTAPKVITIGQNWAAGLGKKR
jgi:hypothetical protein